MHPQFARLERTGHRHLVSASILLGQRQQHHFIPLLLTWQTVTPPDYLQWHGEAKLGSTAVPLQGEFQLSPDGTEQTNLTFTAQVDPPNKLLAQMIQTAAPKFINSFFSCLKKSAWTV